MSLKWWLPKINGNPGTLLKKIELQESLLRISRYLYAFQDGHTKEELFLVGSHFYDTNNYLAFEACLRQRAQLHKCLHEGHSHLRSSKHSKILIRCRFQRHWAQYFLKQFLESSDLVLNWEKSINSRTRTIGTANDHFS
jgi:hypothetical protein